MTGDSSSYDQQENDQRSLEKDWSDARAKKYGPEATTLIEKAWAGGFFDGEGSVSGEQGKGVSCTIEQAIAGEKKSDKSSSGSIRGLLNLERFQAAVGVGRIVNRPLRERGNEQPTAQWIVSSQQDIETVWNAIGDFLGRAKRDQFSNTLSIPVQTAIVHEKPLPTGTIGVDVERK